MKLVDKGHQEIADIICRHWVAEFGIPETLIHGGELARTKYDEVMLSRNNLESTWNGSEMDMKLIWKLVRQVTRTVGSETGR